MRQLISPGNSKALLITLAASLVVAVLMAVLHLVPRYRLLDQLGPPELFEATIDQVVHNEAIPPPKSATRL